MRDEAQAVLYACEDEDGKELEAEARRAIDVRPVEEQGRLLERLEALDGYDGCVGPSSPGVGVRYFRRRRRAVRLAQLCA